MNFWRTALVLGLLSAVGPFAIDMYLPAMPAIEAGLAATSREVQGTLTFYFLAFGLSQLIYGPIADRYGRRPPLLAGLVIFGLGSVLSALAPTVDWLVAGRFVQGLGAAAVMVVPRAIIRDQMTGPDAARLMAAIMMVISVSPMLAPLAGAGLLALADWRAIFWVLGGAGLVSLIIALLFQPETLKDDARVPISLPVMGQGVRTLFGSPIFMGLTFVGAFGFASFFVFIAEASFVYSGTYGLTPAQFGLAFAVNAVGFIGASQFAGALGGRFGMGAMMRGAVIGFAGFTFLNLLVVLLGLGSLWSLIGLSMLASAGLGLVIPGAMVMALDDHGEIAGLASSLGGTLQMVTGAAITAAAGPFFNGTPLPMVATMAVCAALTLGTALWVMPRLQARATTA
jgi:MFS transporter, DHA1 family, multidrug resistance protein